MNSDSNSTKASVNFVPPSEEIQRLFTFDKPPSENGVSILNKEDNSFSDEDFAKMPSTLMKAVRRTDALLIQTDAAKKAAIETNNEVKSIHSLLVRHAKKLLKDLEKNNAVSESTLEKNNTKGFRRKCRISDVMCEFMGLPRNTLSSRVDVNKAINDYIKTNGLVDNENAQHIFPDEKLWSMLSEDAKGNKITYFSIQKYIKHHYLVAA